MINRTPPRDWRDLQSQVAKILQECGFVSEVEKNIQTVRGVVNIDVYAEDLSSEPRVIYLCECKRWNTATPKTVVHAFRTVVNDYGANWGFIISSGGFQSGAFAAAEKSNIRLLTWEKFQELFVDRWIKNYMKPRLREEVDPLVEYTEPINSRIFRKANKLNDQPKQKFIQLREQYWGLAHIALLFYVPIGPPFSNRLDLPLRNAVKDEELLDLKIGNIPDELLDATCLRDFLDIMIDNAREGLVAFDEVFGERA